MTVGHATFMIHANQVLQVRLYDLGLLCHEIYFLRQSTVSPLEGGYLKTLALVVSLLG